MGGVSCWRPQTANLTQIPITPTDLRTLETLTFLSDTKIARFSNFYTKQIFCGESHIVVRRVTGIWDQDLTVFFFEKVRFSQFGFR